MKFGLHLHRHLLAKWADHYVDYNGLRRMIRVELQPQNKADFAEVFEYLSENIRSLEAFRRKKYESVVRRETELCARFTLPSAPVTLPNIDFVEVHELAFVLFVYEDLLLELKEIQWFDRINETAITKIFHKIANDDQETSNDYHRLHSQWLAVQQNLEKPRVWAHKRISKLIADIRRVRAVPQLGARSLYLGSLSSDTWPLAFTQDDLYRVLKNDDCHAAQKILLAFGDLMAERGHDSGTLLYDMFILAGIFESNNTAILILDALLNENAAINTNQMSLFLRICGQKMQKEPHQSQHLSREHRQNVTFDDLLSKLLNDSDSATSFLLGEKDIQGCLPLHYAAQYGLTNFCRALVFCALGSESQPVVAEALFSRDHEGNTPIHYAVLSGHTPVLTVLLQGLFLVQKNKQTMSDIKNLLGDLLLLSLRAKEDEMVEVLLGNGPDLNYRSVRGETALYCAAQAGNLGLVQLLLKHMLQHGLGIDLAEKTTGWTPLMAACANGHQEVVRCLLEAGAEPGSRDILGWTAQEHATFRGHLAIAELFPSTSPGNPHEGPASSCRIAHKSPPRIVRATGDSLVVVNLGSTQGGHERATFELSHFNRGSNYGLGATTPLVLEISAPGTDARAKTVQLPILEDQINQPFIFQAKENAPLKIVVRLYRRESADSMLLSSGMAILNHEKVHFGDKRESMIREVTVFMMDKDTMDLAGTVLLSYVVATPFMGLQQPNTANYHRRVGDPVRLVGHRGLGQNTASRSFLQLGENTAMSFLSAAKLGASFMEFDLQVTRDLEAVIFHDFSLSESGTDIPIHDLTLAQYKHASDLQEPRSMAPVSLSTRGGGLLDPPRRRRAWSTGDESQSRAVQLRDRLRYTVDFQNKGFKPNTRGDFIQGSLTTLEELLVDLPQEIGFNIEMKYPRFHEAVEAGVAPVTIDLNTFIDVALEKIQRLAGERPIILSSFTPEVCILLSVKQKAYPVMFITNAGKVPMTDQELRAASLQMAVHFAQRWNLSGIVFACETLLYCPRLVQFVKNAGLVCASYGLLNNYPANARRQADAGVDIIVADRVKLIADELLKDLESNRLN